MQIAGNGKTFPPPRRWKTEATNPTTKQGPPLHGVCHSSPLVAVHHQAKTQSSASTRTTATSARGCFLLAFALRLRPRPTGRRPPPESQFPHIYLSIDAPSILLQACQAVFFSSSSAPYRALGFSIVGEPGE